MTLLPFQLLDISYQTTGSPNLFTPYHTIKYISLTIATSLASSPEFSLFSMGVVYCKSLPRAFLCFPLLYNSVMLSARWCMCPLNQQTLFLSVNYTNMMCYSNLTDKIVMQQSTCTVQTHLTHFAYLYLSRDVRKTVFGVSDQVQHKPGCAATEDS